MSISTFNHASYDPRRVASHPFKIPIYSFEAPFDKIKIIRIQDYNERYFHGVQINGTSYNSFVFEHSPGEWTVVDSCKDDFADIYVASVKEIVGDLNKVTRIICHHSEWDHSSSIVHLYQLTPNATIVASPNCIVAMKRFFPALQHARWESWKNGLVTEFGDFRLTFVHTPLLHWSDSAVSKLDHLPSGKGLFFSMDIFGAHIAGEEVFMDEYKKEHGYSNWRSEASEYYANTVSCYRLQTKQTLAKLPSFGAIDIIANAHGPIYRRSEDIVDVVKLYTSFANNERTENKITIYYDTNFNSTGISCEVVAARLRARGMKVKLIRFSAFDKAFWGREAVDTEAFIFASATLNNSCQPYVAMGINYLGSLDLVKKMPCAILTHYGWNEKVCAKKMRTLLEMEGAQFPIDDCHIQWRADDTDIPRLEQFADNFADAVIANRVSKMKI